MQYAAFVDRPADARNVVDRCRWVGEAVRRRDEAGRVAYRAAFDRRLGSVEERVEHLRIESTELRLLRRQPVVSPYSVGRGLGEVRQPLVAAARGHHAETCRARPVDEIADERGLVAVSEAVNDAGLGRAAGEQGSALASASTVTLMTRLP